MVRYGLVQCTRAGRGRRYESEDGGQRAGLDQEIVYEMGIQSYKCTVGDSPFSLVPFGPGRFWDHFPFTFPLPSISYPVVAVFIGISVGIELQCIFGWKPSQERMLYP